MRFPALLAVVLLLPAAAEARPKRKVAVKAGGSSPPACGVKALPLAVGNQWTYNPVPAPMPAPDAITRIAPAQPKQITITVKSVEPKDGATVVTLEEAFQIDRTRPGEEKTKPNIEERTVTSTITCTDKRFDISPNSFFFAAEPGGFVGLEITKLERLKNATSWVLPKGTIGENEWREDLVIQFQQTPHEGAGAKLANGKLELERQFTPQQPEKVTTKIGVFDSEKLGLVTTGRVTLDNPFSSTLKPMELPAGWVSQIWLVPGQGMIQALNSYGHMYQLVDLQLK